MIPSFLVNGFTLTCLYQLETPVVAVEPTTAEPMKVEYSMSGSQTVHTYRGTDRTITLTIRGIPTATHGLITGWDGASGWKMAIAWMRRGKTFTFTPDVAGTTAYSMVLIDPINGGPELEEDGGKKITLTLREVAGANIMEY
jgi:hypothetical protein